MKKTIIYLYDPNIHHKRIIETLHSHVEEMRILINENLKDDGDTSETSQRMCILNNLRSVESSINGIAKEDLIQP